MSNIRYSGDGGILRRARPLGDGTFADQVEMLGTPDVARQIPAGATSANQALTTTCRRASLYARGADIRYSVGSTAQTANADTGHLIAAGERIDIVLPITPNIAAIRASHSVSSGTLEVTELL